MTTSPLVSVVMPVYNGERFLREAIESILNQTFTDYEFIIIDDGSTDRTWDILADYKDRRIRVVRNEKNLGLIRSLNKGLELARGKYIARMDADDVSLPTRFAKQIDFLNEHPEIGVLGTWIEYIDESANSQGVWRTPVRPKVVNWALLFGTCLAHPSVVLRQAVIERAGFYSTATDALHVEDYALWAHMTEISSMANIPEVLLHRRVWDESICSRYSQAQDIRSRTITYALHRQLLGEEASLEMIDTIRLATRGEHICEHRKATAAGKYLIHLRHAYLAASHLQRRDAQEINRDVGRKLLTLADAARGGSWKAAFFLLMRAVRFDQGIISWHVLFRGIRRMLRRRG